MPVLAECNVENVCRSHRASNGLGEEQRANLSMLRLGHQTGRNQLLRRKEEEEEGGVGSRRWWQQWGGSFPLTFIHFFFSHKEKFSYFKHLLRERVALTEIEKIVMKTETDKKNGKMVFEKGMDNAGGQRRTLQNIS